MSNSIFPTLAGKGWSVTKTPMWSTRVQKTVSQKEYRSALAAYPVYNLLMNFEVLREASAFQELQTILGFFNARQGSFDSFLLDDTSDDSITAQAIGTGDGVTTQFQTVRAYGGFVEPVMNINTIVGVYDNGSPVTQGAGAGKYTISSTGLITFGTPPLAGHALTWSGTFYYRCRFSKDSNDFENFMYQLWAFKKCELVGTLGNKI